MSLVILIPLLVCFLGLIAYLAAKANGEVKELGRLTYFAGLLVTLFVVATHVLRL